MIDNAGDLAVTPSHELALDCLAAGIEAADPTHAVHEQVSLSGDHLEIGGQHYDCSTVDEVLVVGGGKAAGSVASALSAILGDAITGGVVVTDDPADIDRVDVVEGDHPIPSERGERGARRALELAGQADERTLVLAVVTGGASALLPVPAGDLSLTVLQSLTDELLSAGATIDEINAVRKHCSGIKGGRLAAAARPATVVGLLVSDVVGDDPSVIGSGPIAPDETAYEDALAVLDRYDIDAPDVRAHLEAGRAGDRPETPTADDSAFDAVQTVFLTDAWTAIEAASDVAREAGYDPLVLSSRFRGEAREAALAHVAVAEEITATGTPTEPPAVVLSGGETTVTVTGDGTGGPNQEFALAAALEALGDTVVATVDTDGRDGGSDAAGAIVDDDTVDDETVARDALTDNDAGGYLVGRNGLIRTGPTGTNVNDLRVLVVED